MKRVLAILVAYVVGWVVYMVAMMMTVYDGILSMILQPFMAALCSGFFVTISLIAGLILRIRPLSGVWKAMRAWAIAMIVSSLVVLSFGSHLGITEHYTDYETGREFDGLHSWAALGAYFALVFAIVNWPLKKRMIAEQGDAV